MTNLAQSTAQFDTSDLISDESIEQLFADITEQFPEFEGARDFLRNGDTSNLDDKKRVEEETGISFGDEDH